MELEGTLIVERRPLRRWVSAIAVIVPVVAFMGATAWFIRAFVAPPMVAIPSPMTLASAPPAPAPRAPPQTAPPQQIKPAAAAEPTAPANAETPAPAAEKPAAAASTAAPVTGLPMFASLAAAPPALTAGHAPSAFADPTADRHAAMMPADAAAQSADPGAADPIVGAVPIPRSRPEVAVALVTASVPLPRPRPGEAAPEPAPEIVPVYRHSVE
jgi:hypothetical protein